MFALFRRSIEERLPATLSRAIAFSLTDSAAFDAELQEQLETGLEVRNDVWYAGVTTAAKSTMAIFRNFVGEPGPLVFELASQPANEAPHGFGVEAITCTFLAFGEMADVDAVLKELQNQHPRPNRLPPWNILASREDQGAWWFRLSQPSG